MNSSMKQLFQAALLILFLSTGTNETLHAANYSYAQITIPEALHDLLKECADHYAITPQEAFTEYDRGIITIEKMDPQHYLVKRGGGDPIIILIDSL